MWGVGGECLSTAWNSTLVRNSMCAMTCRWVILTSLEARKVVLLTFLTFVKVPQSEHWKPKTMLILWCSSALIFPNFVCPPNGPAISLEFSLLSWRVNPSHHQNSTCVKCTCSPSALSNQSMLPVLLLPIVYAYHCPFCNSRFFSVADVSLLNWTGLLLARMFV